MPHFIKLTLLENLDAKNVFDPDTAVIERINIDYIARFMPADVSLDNGQTNNEGTEMLFVDGNISYYKETPDEIVAIIDNAANGIWPVPAKKKEN